MPCRRSERPPALTAAAASSIAHEAAALVLGSQRWNRVGRVEDRGKPAVRTSGGPARAGQAAPEPSPGSTGLPRPHPGCGRPAGAHRGPAGAGSVAGSSSRGPSGAQASARVNRDPRVSPRVWFFAPSNPAESRGRCSPGFRGGAIAPSSTRSASQLLPSPRNLVRAFHWRSRSSERADPPTRASLLAAAAGRASGARSGGYVFPLGLRLRPGGLIVSPERLRAPLVARTRTASRLLSRCCDRRGDR